MSDDLDPGRVYNIDNVPGLYIVEGRALERLLFDRNLMGWEFRATCLEASRSLLRRFVDVLPIEACAELVVLSKGLVYQVAQAFGEVTGRNLPVNLVATRRESVSVNKAKIVVSYCSFDAGGTTLIIGDTVATGATIVAALTEYRLHHELEAVFIMSYAGTLGGALHVADYCRENNIKLTMFYGLAAFGLGPNGFDISFLDSETITSDRFREKAKAQFGELAVSAVGWDFGSQAMAPAKYRALTWIEAEYWNLHGHSSLAVGRRPRSLDLVTREVDAYATIADRVQESFKD